MNLFSRRGLALNVFIAIVLSASLAGVVVIHRAVADLPVSSRFTVKLPQEDTQLLINDKLRPGLGEMREHYVNLLAPGKTYKYTFTARWRPNNFTDVTRSRQIEFKGGDTVYVDLATDNRGDHAKVRYVPTPDNIVRTMIEMAKITADDVIYEPGCGDARITIAAVKAGASKGVGIDLDQERVTEARANVSAARLENSIEIRLGDALEIKDLSQASVVFLYMGDEFDMLIRPILWRELGVGARVVSHRFTMGNWIPDRSQDVVDFDYNATYQVHLWTITPEVKARVEKKQGVE